MIKKFIFLFLVLTGNLQLIAQSKVTVAVASNMQYAIRELITEFNKTDSTKIEVIMGASGKLTQQIIHGAPIDIFISADKVFPETLAKQKLALIPPKVYARGVLVLWTVNPNIQPAKDLSFLLSSTIRTIAIANPGTAPYGNAAVHLLKEKGVYDKISYKLVTGESITQATQFIATGNADIGFTAKSMVQEGSVNNKGTWVELDINEYPPIDQAAVLLKYSKQTNEKGAERFYNFLYSDAAKSIFKKLGYIIE